MKKKSRIKLKRKPVTNIGDVKKLRIALFTHDTFGLGHVKRSLNIIRALAQRVPDAAILLITGCPALHAVKDLPPNADCVKIPTIVKTGSKDSQPPHLSLSVFETTLLRTRIVKETVLAFSPDVFIVDNFPLGSQAELLPVLQALEPLHTKAVLGLRDILDAPDVVQGDWKRQGIYDVLERYYDKILIYGLKSIFDAAKNYALGPCIAKKLRYCGFLTNTGPLNCRPSEIRNQLGVNGSFVLATGGGGGDAYPLLSTFIKSMRKLKGVDSVIFTGPLMGRSDRDKLISESKSSPAIIIREFVPDLRPYMNAADVVVTMCGYNMAGEILAYKPQAIVVPRTWKYGEHAKRNNTKLEKEQIFRARTLERFGFIHLIEPGDLNAQNLSNKISQLLESPKKKSRKRINVRGVENAAREIIETAVN
jgi:predicted glycosyltransferase